MHTQNPFKDPEDRLQFAKALDRLKESQTKNRATFTDFLNPQMGAVFLQHFNKMKIQAKLYGGYQDAERQMLGIAPQCPAKAFQGQSHHGIYKAYEEYEAYEADEAYNAPQQATNEDKTIDPLPENAFPITPLSITYNPRYVKQLTHRDFLGAVLGLGLDRCIIGDIRIGVSGAIMYAANSVTNFITESLKEVGRAAVTAQVNTNTPETQTPGTSKRITAASLRLDAVISAAMHLSRGKATVLIESEKVFVNWIPAKKTQQLAEGDIVTVRQLGRLRLDSIAGTTKKDRVALNITLY